MSSSTWKRSPAAATSLPRPLPISSTSTSSAPTPTNKTSAPGRSSSSSNLAGLSNSACFHLSSWIITWTTPGDTMSLGTPRISVQSPVKILYVSQYFPPEMGAPAARAAELSRHWARMGHEAMVLTGFPNHPTGVVPEDWRARFHRLRYTETCDGVQVIRTWLWPLPNRKAHERIRNYASFCVSAAVSGLALRKPDVVIATSPQLLCALSGWWLAFW